MEIILEKQCNLTPQSLWDEFMSDMKSKKGMSSLELQDLEDKSKWNETSFLDLSNCFNQERTSETLWTAIEKGIVLKNRVERFVYILTCFS